MTPVDASKQVNDKVVHHNLHAARQKRKLQFQLGQLVRKADIKKNSKKELVQIGVTK